jgi:mRNA interferase MazF
VAAYIPHKGDFVSLSFDPQAGHEQKGRRPALVVSNDLFNKHTGLALVCPVTNTQRDVPFHLPVGPSTKLSGFVMVEQVKSIDYQARRARFIGRARTSLLNDVIAILDVIVK